MSDPEGGSNPDLIGPVVSAAVAFLAAVLELFETSRPAATPGETPAPRIQRIRLDDSDEKA